MMRNLLVFCVVGLTISGAAQAACGGTTEFSNDCSSNSRAANSSCCPPTYRVQGLAINDMRGGSDTDAADAVSVICRSIEKGNDMMPGEFQANPITMMCDKTEVFAGLNCTDLKGKDSVDGCVIYCQKPGSNSLRMVGNNGDSGPTGEQHTVLLPKRVVGISSKDNPGGSDQLDCVTIDVK